MTDDDTPTGGPEWERNQAAKRIADAVQAGDAAAIAVGADRLGDAVTNAVTSRLIDGLIQTLNVVVKPQFAELARWLENSDQSRLQRNVEVNLSFTRLHEENDTTLTAVQEVGRGLGKLEKIQKVQGTRIGAIERVLKTRPAQRAAEEQQRAKRHNEVLDRLDARDTLADTRYEEAKDFDAETLAHRERQDAEIAAQRHDIEQMKQELDQLKRTTGEIKEYLPSLPSPEERTDKDHFGPSASSPSSGSGTGQADGDVG
jgi:hypothetical protein